MEVYKSDLINVLNNLRHRTVDIDVIESEEIIIMT